MRTRSLVLLSLVTTALLLRGQEASKPETAAALDDAGVPETVRAVLETSGYRVHPQDGKPVELWLRRDVPVQPPQQVIGVAFGQLPESVLVGVARFPEGWSDFRGQHLRPGVYTLRYARYPADGNHMGVSQYRDFLILSPAASDPEPAAVHSFDELMALSRKASGSNHPAVMSLEPPQAEAFPSVYENWDGNTALALEVPVTSGKLPLALVVKGQAEQ